MGNPKERDFSLIADFSRFSRHHASAMRTEDEEQEMLDWVELEGEGQRSLLEFFFGFEPF